jgi:hypothetical protein
MMSGVNGLRDYAQDGNVCAPLAQKKARRPTGFDLN